MARSLARLQLQGIMQTGLERIKAVSTNVWYCGGAKHPSISVVYVTPLPPPMMSHFSLVPRTDPQCPHLLLFGPRESRGPGSVHFLARRGGKVVQRWWMLHLFAGPARLAASVGGGAVVDGQTERGGGRARNLEGPPHRAPPPSALCLWPSLPLSLARLHRLLSFLPPPSPSPQPPPPPAFAKYWNLPEFSVVAASAAPPRSRSPLRRIVRPSLF